MMSEISDGRDDILNAYHQIKTELSKVIVGHSDLILHLYICLIAGGHALIEGLPGLGKTLTVKTFSKILNLSYSRIQFTPDLMPADILGTHIISENEGQGRQFKFHKGPIFGQVILADEINRASPKTQSALLEAMQEQKISLYGNTYPLIMPFVVFATQNPIEMEGTYPLPEAQIDRFFFKLTVPSPNAEQLMEIANRSQVIDPEPPQKVLNGADILQLKESARQVPIAEHVKAHGVRLILSSHPNAADSIDLVKSYVRYGVSPRGLQSLILAAKIRALIDGRFHTSCEDINAMAKPALCHRIILNLRGAAEGIDPDDIINAIIEHLEQLK